MQGRYSEPSTYKDSLSSAPHGSDDIYDDVASIEGELEVSSPHQYNNKFKSINSATYTQFIPLMHNPFDTTAQCLPRKGHTAFVRHTAQWLCKHLCADKLTIV
jgi:hypothetical protein